jgi:PAS domain S-box-containing protein
MLREVVAVSELQSREEELRRLNNAFEHAIAGIAFVGKDRRFTYVNQTLATALGYQPEELVGMASDQVVDPAHWEEVKKSDAELRENGKSEVEIRGLRKGGDTIEVRLLRVSSFDQDGNFLGNYAFAQDITEQKRAEFALRRSEERFHLAARATSDLIWDRDLRSTAYWTNEALEHQFGYAPDQRDPSGRPEPRQ